MDVYLGDPSCCGFPVDFGHSAEMHKTLTLHVAVRSLLISNSRTSNSAKKRNSWVMWGHGWEFRSPSLKATGGPVLVCKGRRRLPTWQVPWSKLCVFIILGCSAGFLYPASKVSWLYSSLCEGFLLNSSGAGFFRVHWAHACFVKSFRLARTLGSI